MFYILKYFIYSYFVTRLLNMILNGTPHALKNMPMGSYHPMEGAIYDAWSAGYEEAEKEIAYLKAQLLRVGNQEKVIKEAYLAGQMSK